MNLKPALKISLELLPAEQALRRAETHEELADAWWEFCDNFNGKRREYLQEVHNEVLKQIERKNAMRVDVLRAARTL
jgi:hypothetical protein